MTVVTSKSRRVTFFECPNDLNAMIDLAKIADLALLMVDGAYGFEMETFEFLNILQVRGVRGGGDGDVRAPQHPPGGWVVGGLYGLCCRCLRVPTGVLRTARPS